MSNALQPDTAVPTLAFFHDGLSLPPKEGLTVHAYELARALALDGRVHVLIVIADRGRATKEQLSLEPFDSLLIHPDDYYDRDQVQKVISEYSIDLVQNYNTYYISSILGPVAQQCQVPLVAEHHDLEADLAFLRTSDEEATYHEFIQRRAIEFSTLSRFMSPYDFSAITPHLPKESLQKTTLMPVAFSPKGILGGKERTNNTAVFVGNMGYDPNAHAARIICNEVASLLPDVEFLIVGRGSKELPVSNTPNVKLLGEVDDLFTLLSTSRIGLAPLTEGSGLKIKIITYLEAGLPVIGSSLSLHGFPENDALIAADTPQEIANTITHLLTDNRTWQHASSAALNLFDEQFNINVTLDTLVGMYHQTIDTYTPPDVNDEITIVDFSMFPWHRQLKDGSYEPTKQPVLIKGAFV